MADTATQTYSGETRTFAKPTAASNRWAIILKETGEVMITMIMDGTAPEINRDMFDSKRYEVLQVGPGVLIGMVKGGPQFPVDGYGFPAGVDTSGRSLLETPPETGVDPSTSHAKMRADEDPNRAKLRNADPMAAPHKTAAQLAAEEKVADERLARAGAGKR